VHTAGIAALLAFAPTCLAADRNADVPRYSSFVFENDFFIADDGGYTNGLAWSWAYGPFETFEGRTPGWVDWLAGGLYIATLPDRRRQVSYSVVQEIYTPEEIAIKEVDPDDRPYAGLLTWQTNWYAYDDRVSDRLGLELGVLGPLSFAEESQKLVHEITGANKPEGWDEQLDDEPVFRVSAQRNWRLSDGLVRGAEYDVVGLLHGGAGNRRSDLGSGAALRIGRGLRHSLPNLSLTPARDVNLMAGHPGSWYAFLGLGAQYVFNDITIDGNTFDDDSPSVELENLQGTATAGAALNIGNWSWLFSVRYITDEFETQVKDSLYGSLSVSYGFSER